MSSGSVYAGIELRNPLIAASSGITRNADYCMRCEDAGFGAVVLKSVQEEVLMRHNPFPRFDILRSGAVPFRSTTFYSYEQAYEGDIDSYCETIRSTKEHLSIPVVASINCIEAAKWSEYALVCEQAGADAIEIVATCPTGLIIRDTSNNIRKVMVQALESTKAAVTIPVVPKMTSQLSDILSAAGELEAAGADGLTMFNRKTGIEIDVDKQVPILYGGLAGHGGSWALHSMLRWVISAQALVKVPISATGGVSTGEDVIKCLLAGAHSVQIASIVYLKGFEWVPGMLNEIEMYMEKKEIVSLQDIIGVAANNMKTMAEYDRSTRYRASIDKSACVNCGNCINSCIYDALLRRPQHPEIDGSRCDGCGLCASLCETGAIKMQVKEQ